MRIIKNIILLLFAFSLSSCSELIECIISVKPVLQNKQLALAYNGQGYEDFITGEVRNDSRDDYYGYFFTVDGNLPPGISYNQAGRRIVFFGIPSQIGTYTFKIIMTIEPPEVYDNPYDEIDENGDGLCLGNDTTSKTYSITVQ
jgi:hypothetical protein